MDSMFGFLNIRGISSKIEEVRVILNQQNFSMLCLAETFLNKHDSDSVYAEPGYQMIRRDCGYGCGGGLAVYIHNSLQFECLGQLDSSMPESINIKVKPKSTE